MNTSSLFAFVFGAFLLCVLPCHAQEKSTFVKKLEAGQQQTLLTYGTSLTAGGKWVKQLEEILNKTYPGKTTLINSAKSGMWSKWGVDNLNERVISKKPDTILIEFAINDAYLKYKTSVKQAEENLGNMIDRILKSNPQCEIVLMVMNPPIKEHLEQRPQITDYYQMYREVAKARKLLLIDHYPAWDKILSDDPKSFNEYVPDGIHPGPIGCSNVITPNIVKGLGIKVELIP